MNRHDIAYIHGGDYVEGGYNLFCLSGRPYNVIRKFLDVGRQLYLMDTKMWLWSIRKWDKKHMKDHHIYLATVAHKRFFDANFRELF
jgi:hypothetical protein